MTMRPSIVSIALTALIAGALHAPLPAFANEPCLGPISRNMPRAPDGTLILPANLTAGEVRITYVGHSTFTIESPGGAVAATDYNDYVRPIDPPHVATMNHAHSTHYTLNPDPAIRHVLRGWGQGGAIPKHDVQERDLRIRNVPTNIRNLYGEGRTEFYGNSIFIFEVAGLCIAHLGHLHHTLTSEHLAAIGQIDVALVPVDGSWTMDLSGMLEVIGQLRAKVVVPMHYFSERTLENFLSRVGQTHAIERVGNISMILSRPTLPETPTVRVLIGR